MVYGQQPPCARYPELGRSHRPHPPEELSLVIRGEMQDNRPVPGGRVHRKKLIPAIDHGFADVPRRWFMVDIDSWPIPDNVSDDSSIEQILELAIATLLPAEFRTLQPTGSYRAARDFKAKHHLRCHLWYWCDRPIENEPLRRWFTGMAAANTTAGHGKQPDPAVCNPVQVHYVADPIIEGGPDPIRQRTGWLLGERDEVTVPDLKKIDHKKAQRDQAAGVGFSPSQAENIEAILARMGDGPGLGGFHEVILGASWADARLTPTWRRSLDDIKGRLREAVLTAPRGNARSDAEIERYTSDSFLDDIIQGAFNKLPNVTADGLPHPPRYPMPTMTVTEARVAMKAAVVEFSQNLWDGNQRSPPGIDN